jgi:hypothetical protein
LGYVFRFLGVVFIESDPVKELQACVYLFNIDTYLASGYFLTNCVSLTIVRASDYGKPFGVYLIDKRSNRFALRTPRCGSF